MAGKILLINPSAPGKRRRKHKKSATASYTAKRRKTRAKRKTAPRSSTMARRTRRHAKRRVHARRHRAANPIRTAKARRARKRRNTVHGYYPNPIHKRRKHHAKRRRHNPIHRNMGTVKGLLKGAGVGIAGSVGLSIVWGQVHKFLPVNMATGTLGVAAKVVGAVLLTKGLEKVMKKETAHQAGVGMLTVIGTGLVHDLLARSMPRLAMNGVMNPGMIMNEYYAGSAGGPAQAPGLIHASGIQEFDPMSVGSESEMGAYFNPMSVGSESEMGAYFNM